MLLKRFRIGLSFVYAGILCLAAGAGADTIKGVVSDSLNGMLLDSVTVAAGGATALSDAKGAFTLVIPGTGVAEFTPPRNLPALTWDPVNGTFSWNGYSGNVSITVRALQGNVVARAVPGKNTVGSTFSIATLPQGIYTVAIESQGQRSTYKISSFKTQQRRTFSLLSPNSSRAKAAAGDHVLTFTKKNFDPVTVTVPAGPKDDIAVKMKSPYPLRNVLHLFSAPGIPETGPLEYPTTPRKWTAPSTLPQHIGNGISRHDMLYFGESYRRILLVVGGKVVWEYDTKDGWEIDDIWMLSNGNILYAHMSYIEEVTPKKEVVWHMDSPDGSEIHTCQPIGLDKVLFVQNQVPQSRVRLYNTVTKTFEIDQEVPLLGGVQHTQCRRFRATGRGTYIAASLGNGKVFELDKDFKEIWSYSTPKPWSGVPLKNGNVLIQDEGARTTFEVNKAGEVVWKVAQTEIKLPAGTQMANTQTCERLSTGNTVVFGNGHTNPKNIQAFEVTPAKEVVWFLQDWINLGDATSAQFLDEPGYPEVPGQTNH